MKILLLLCTITFASNFAGVIIEDGKSGSSNVVSVTSDSALKVTIGTDTLNVTISDTLNVKMADTLNTTIADTLNVILFDTLGNSVEVDAVTNALVTIDCELHKIHNGSHYFIEGVEDLSSGDVFDVQWTTPNTTEWAHFNFELVCESETNWYIYESATISTAGTALTAINNNRNSANTSSATIAAISNSSVANANSDTPVAGATTLAHGRIGDRREGGITERDSELILKQNTIYCMRAVSNTAGYVNFRMSWYEHTNKN